VAAEHGNLCVKRAEGVLRVEGSGLLPESAVDLTGGAGDTLRDSVEADGTVDLEIGGRLATPPYWVASTWETGGPAELTTARSEGATAPTTPTAGVDALLVVETPGIGDHFSSGSPIRGETSTPTVEYRLKAGEVVLAEGTIDAVDGTFETVVEFTNTCCTEMTLEVTQPNANGATLSIPLDFPESS
jgi:hypothetical protein